MVSELSFSLFVCTYNGILILIHIAKGPAICSLYNETFWLRFKLKKKWFSSYGFLFLCTDRTDKNTWKMISTCFFSEM